MKYRHLIFDLDNTIFDYNTAENFALDKTLKHFGLPASGELKESYRRINEQTWRRFESGEITSEELRVQRFESFGSAHGIDWDAEDVSSVYLGNLGLGGFLVDGAEILLNELKPDFKIGAVTNGISDVQRARLSHSPFSAFFSPIIISDEVGIAKPSPGIFEIYLERAGINDRSTVLMIGDSLTSDMAGSSAAGIDCCWFNPLGIENDSEVRPDYEISRLDQLKSIVYGDE